MVGVRVEREEGELEGMLGGGGIMQKRHYGGLQFGGEHVSLYIVAFCL